MTSDTIVDFLERRPFVGFDLFTVDNRVIRVSHPEVASTGMYATSVYVVHPDGQLEIFDAALIVSCRSHQPVPGF